MPHTHIEKIINDLNLVADGERPLRKVAQKSGNMDGYRMEHRDAKGAHDLRYFATTSAFLDFI
jgi:hypothetical protein